jgi:hypothetical protein
LLQAFQPRFLCLVTIDFDSGWSYGWIILAHVWCIPRGVIHMSTSVLVALYSKVFKVFLCAYHSWQISTMSLSNNVPLRVYAHTTGWPPPCNLFFSNKQDYISSHSEVINPTASSTSPGSDFLCSCKTDEQGHSDSYGYMYWQIVFVAFFPIEHAGQSSSTRCFDQS